jgi:hypothetical protein
LFEMIEIRRRPRGKEGPWEPVTSPDSLMAAQRMIEELGLLAPGWDLDIFLDGHPWRDPMELRYPGAAPVIEAPAAGSEAAHLFQIIEHLLGEARTALVLFEDAAKLGSLERLKPHRVFLPALFAKAFIIPAHLTSVLLQTIAKRAPEIRPAMDQLKAGVPGITDVRHSIQHIEDRVLGLAKGKRIDLQPIDNSLVRAPGGGVSVIDGLRGDLYGITCENGSYIEIPVNEATLVSILRAVQTAIDALHWEGPSRTESFRPDRRRERVD